MTRVKHTEGSCSCGAPLTCPARIGAKGGRSTSPRKLETALENLKRAQKNRPLFKCSCGARGRDISRWPSAKGIKTKCRKCGKTTTRRTKMTSAIVKCRHRQCKWSEIVQPGKCLFTDNAEIYIGDDLPALLKSAWSIGLEHAWDNRGHIVETFVDGKLKATQQVADMSPWHDHNTVIVEEGIE